MTELDPRWRWANVQAMGDPGPVYIRGECLHLETVPVTLSLTGEVAADLCITCDTGFYRPYWGL